TSAYSDVAFYPPKKRHLRRTSQGATMRFTGLSLLAMAFLVSVASASANSPQFLEPLQVFVGGRTDAVAFADFNHDGNTDMVAGTYNNSVAILLGTGRGFGFPVTYPLPGAPIAIAIADLNRDGKLDVMTANSSSTDTAVSVLLGNGDGTFQPQVSYAAAP